MNHEQDENFDNINENEEEKYQNDQRKSYEDQLIDKNYDILEKYPVYKVKPLKWNPPATYFHTKRQIDSPQEYIPPPKKISREVNPENLSEDQKQLYGKNLFEKDLEIIKQRNSQLENSQRKPRSSSVNRIRPPDIFYREEAERRQKNEELQKYEDQIRKQNKKKEIRQKRQFEKERIKLDRIKAERDYDRKIQFEIYEEEKRKEIKKRLDYLNSIQIKSDRPTRSSALKEEISKKKIQRSFIDERKKTLNRELKNEKLKMESKKISNVIDEINPKIKNDEKMKMRKQKLRKNERDWNKWLALTEQTNRTRETMIERLYSKYDM